MKKPLIILSAALVGCSNPYYLMKFGHNSNPREGWPVNSNCDPTADYIGGGIGAEHQHENGSVTEWDTTLGAKRIRQCVFLLNGEPLPAIDDASFGAEFEIRHKIPMRR